MTRKEQAPTSPARRWKRGLREFRELTLRRAPRWMQCFCCVLMFSVLICPAVLARDLVIRHFDVQITVHEDSTIEVAELIDVHFTGAWHGIYRTIPIEYRNPQGFNYTLFLKILSVTDDDGRPLKYEVSREGNSRKFKIWVPNAEDATRTVILRYRVLNGLRFFDDHDELYWNVTGNQWQFPIQSATAKIELPSGASGVRGAAFTGIYGAREQNADVETKSNVINLRTRSPLGYAEGLTAVIAWDKGIVHPPGRLARGLLFLESNWPLLLPMAAFGLMFWLWYTRGRDPRSLPITVQYEPPDNLSPGEAGTLIDNQAAMRDITATVVDLGVKGYLIIEEKQTGQLLGLLHHRDYVFHMKKPPSEWAPAKPHEREILDALFQGGARDSVSLADLQNHFYKHLPAIRDGIFESLMADKYFLHRPDKVRHGFLTAGVIIGLLIAWGGTAASAAFGYAPQTAIVAAVLTGLVICGFGWFMPAHTMTGARAKEKVLGFEEFLARVEEPRFQQVVKTPEMFEKFLPYAMALHVEKRWGRAFADICRQPPQWYQGGYGPNFNPVFFTNDLSSMSAQAGTAMASAPRGSGSSGFGGGGFSGGGFGGGGGGGF